MSGGEVAWGMMALAGLMAGGQALATNQAAKTNEKIQRMNAEMATNSAKLQADQVRADGARRLAAIQADAAASGFTQEGTVLDTLFSQARETEREAQIALYNGQVQSTANLARVSQIKSEAFGSNISTLSSFGMNAASMGSSSGLKK